MKPSHSSLNHLEHRPWPLPEGGWTWRQTWRDLLFAHWECDADALAGRIPQGLELDTFDGKAWVGLVPFTMHGIARRPFPPLPGFNAFPEFNVRTYVLRDGKPGVWFFSLDINHPVAVWAARTFFHLPYRLAAMEVRKTGGAVWYRSCFGGEVFEAEYAVLSWEAFAATPFTTWCTERYCLYSADAAGALYRGEIHHRRWPLVSGRLDIRRNTMLESLACGAMHREVLYCPEIEVVVWPLAGV